MTDAIHLVVSGERPAFVAHGDCRKRLKELPDNSIDAVVTDPPAGIEFMGREWDKFSDVEANLSGKQTAAWDESGGASGSRPFARSATPRYQGKTKESLLPFQDFMTEVFTEVYRVLKPGAHALVWGIPRTSHHTAMALERAGFEIRDVVSHLFGTGFPKSLDVSKTMAKRAGAKQWPGWGTALKPAQEVWILARKPLIGTVAENVQKHGTGALNIDGCRVGFASEEDRKKAHENALGPVERSKTTKAIYEGGKQNGGFADTHSPLGRWPANLVLSHSEGCTDSECEPECAARMLNEQSGVTAARFFYTAKAPTSEKASVLECSCTPNLKIKDIPVVSMKEAKEKQGTPCSTCGSPFKLHAHPTVKSISLMEWLVKLITPPGGLVLDPFTGSGSTGVAARKQGFRFLGTERDEVYCALARYRVKNAGDAVKE